MKKKTIIVSSLICLFVLVLSSTYYWGDMYYVFIIAPYSKILFPLSELVIIVFLIIRLKKKKKLFPYLLLLIVPIISFVVFLMPSKINTLRRNYRIRNECRREFNESRESFEAVVDLLMQDQQTYGDAYYSIYEDRDNKGKYIVYRHTKKNSEIVELSEEQEKCLEKAEKSFNNIAGHESVGFSGVYVASTEVCFNDQECTKGQLLLSLDGKRTVGVMEYFEEEYKESTVKVELGEEWYAYYYIGVPWKVNIFSLWK